MDSCTLVSLVLLLRRRRMLARIIKRTWMKAHNFSSSGTQYPKAKIPRLKWERERERSNNHSLSPILQRSVGEFRDLILIGLWPFLDWDDLWVFIHPLSPTIQHSISAFRDDMIDQFKTNSLCETVKAGLFGGCLEEDFHTLQKFERKKKEATSLCHQPHQCSYLQSICALFCRGTEYSMSKCGFSEVVCCLLKGRTIAGSKWYW